MDIRDKIKNGDYNNKLPYPKQTDFIKGYSEVDEYKEAIKAYRQESNRLINQFKADVLEEVGLTGHPKAEKVWKIAWEKGHGSGYHEVWYHVDELAELVK